MWNREQGTAYLGGENLLAKGAGSCQGASHRGRCGWRAGREWAEGASLGATVSARVSLASLTCIPDPGLAPGMLPEQGGCGCAETWPLRGKLVLGSPG